MRGRRGGRLSALGVRHIDLGHAAGIDPAARCEDVACFIEQFLDGADREQCGGGGEEVAAFTERLWVAACYGVTRLAAVAIKTGR